MISSAFTLKQLEALIWVADLGSFRKAAAHLNTTQPNISSRIAGLEKTLGLSLMQRDTGSVQLTAKGAEIVAQARVVLQNADTLLNIAGRPDLHTDRIRLGVTELVAYTWLREFMRRVSDVFPNVSIELTVDLSRNLDKELASNTLDLAIQTAPFSVQTTGEIALGAYPFAWVAAHDIAVNTAPVSVAISKRLLWESFSMTSDDMNQAESALHQHLMGKADAHEGVTSFLERREPKWSLTVNENWPENWPDNKNS